MVMTRSFSLANMRLVLANWLSSNIGVYALALLGACIALGILDLAGCSAVWARSHETEPDEKAARAHAAAMLAFAPAAQATSAARSLGALSAEIRHAADGRVVDDLNGAISHSESQGYGLLLACLAGDRTSFARILAFTRTELLDPRRRARRLALGPEGDAARHRHQQRHRWRSADRLCAELCRFGLGDARLHQRRPPAGPQHREGHLPETRQRNLLAYAGRHRLPRRRTEPTDPWLQPLLLGLRGAAGDGERLTGDNGWLKVQATGLKLLDTLAKANMPAPEWMSVKAEPRPADGFPAHLGYNAMRVPLYLLRAGLGEPGRLAPFRAAWANGPAIVDDLGSKQAVDAALGSRLPDPRSRAGLRCRRHRDPARAEILRADGLLPSTLHLLTLAMLSERYQRCM